MTTRGLQKLAYRRHCRGQSLTEYVLACAVLAFILFVPITDAASKGGAKTTVQIVIDGFKLAYQRFSYAISIPT